MYLRSVHAEKDLRVLRQLIRDNPLGLLTTAIKSDEHPLLQSSHIPFVIDVQDDASETELGRLRGHIARPNPQSKAIVEELTARSEAAGSKVNVLEQDVLVVFTAQHHHYVTPKFYAETKPSTGKVVPTWNYAAAQAYGRATVYYDPKAAETAEFLDAQIADLTRHNETGVMGYTGVDGRQEGWKVTDAPGRYVELLRKNIIGVEVDITSLGGKFKMSQEMSEGDREGVVEGFLALETETARAVGESVRARGELKDQAKQASAT